MDKIKLKLKDGKTMKRNYPDDSISWDRVEEIEILPADIRPGTMAGLCREIMEHLDGQEKNVIRIEVKNLTEEARKWRNAYLKQWREKNPERYREYRRAYYEKNKEKIKAANSEWRRKNRDKVRKNLEAFYERKAQEMKEAE